MTAEERITNYLKRIKKEDKKMNSFIEVNENAAEEARLTDKKKTKGKLAGLAIAVKSNICVKGMLTSCASKTLENYRAPYDADVIKKIKAEDGVVIGMTNQDEFAGGASGETSFFGPTDNPAASGRIPGGSSSGSAAAVAACFCDVALGTDTGGSIRNPASHCGVIGIKPSYGRVSRYGLIDLSMSLDQIGPLSKNVFDSALILNVIAGGSKFDATTLSKPVPDYTKFKNIKNIKIGVSSDFKKIGGSEEIHNLIDNSILKISKAYKLRTKNIRLEYIDMALQAYYLLNYVEFFSATRKFDGRKYGSVIEENCGKEVLRRIVGGNEISQAEYRGAYYRRALKAKALIRKDFEDAFKSVDVILSPTVPNLPHKIGTKITDPKIMYAYDAFTIPANLAGVCAGVIKAGEINKIPVGLQVTAPAFKEDMMFNVLKAVEDLNG